MTELNKDDLILLLDSYKNMVGSNTVLLEQQKTLLIDHEKIIDKQSEIIDKIITESSTRKNDIQNIKVEVIKGFGSIKHELYIVYAALAVFGISLVSLLITTLDKWKILENIAKNLGVL